MSEAHDDASDGHRRWVGSGAKVRGVFAAAGAALPTAVWATLTFAPPPQYLLILEDSAAKGWPIAWATAVLLLGALLALLLLWKHRLLSFLVAWLAVTPLIAAVASVWILVGFSLSLLLGLVAAVGVPFAVLFATRSSRREAPIWAHRYAGILAVGAMLLTFLAFAIASAISPLGMPRAVGGLTIVSVFLALIGVLACAAVLRPRIAAVVAGWWVVAILFFAPNNHDVRTEEASAESLGVEDALRQWLANRRDLDAYKNARMPYPVIFVSSEGGGIYAAAHAHAVLSTLAARCPTFAQHVLVAVGVSGGAVGNAVFHGTVDPVQKAAAPCTPGVTHLPQDAFVADHLSPVVARLLLLETLDSFLPGSWVDRDRGGLLVDSFRAATSDDGRLNVLVGQSFDPTSARPAIASVATNLGTGGRLVLSPIIAPSSTAQWWPGESTLSGGRDTDVLEAAGISARFPWVTPTARLRVSEGGSLVLADGGYFENSGAETVLDLINELRIAEANEISDEKLGNDTGEPICRIHVARNIDAPAAWDGCAIHVFPIHLAITTTDINPESDSPPAEHSQSFVFDPLSTLISTRSARGLLALKRAQEEHCGTLGAVCVQQPDATSGFFTSYISPRELGLPLGWFIRSDEAAAIARSSVPAEIFGYRSGREPQGHDLGHLILHLDPALWAPNASPGINDYRGQP
jgi:hypothetical protein